MKSMDSFNAEQNNALNYKIETEEVLIFIGKKEVNWCANREKSI